MKSNTLVIIGVVVFGVLALGLTGLLLMSRGGGQTAAQQAAAAPPTKLIVAAREIPPRTFIQPEMLEEREVPADQIPSGAFTSREEIVGKLVSQRVMPGAAIKAEDVVNELGRVIQANFAVPVNLRAVAVSVDPDKTAAGLVDVGDHVDVLVTHEIASKDLIGAGNVQTVAARTLAQNLEVLAVDRSLLAAEMKPETATTEGGADGAAPPPPPPPTAPQGQAARIRVVIAATPDQAERIIAANRSGEINLTIRNPESTDINLAPTQATEYPVQLINATTPEARQAAAQQRAQQQEKAVERSERRYQERREDSRAAQERRQAMEAMRREQEAKLQIARIEATAKVPPMPLVNGTRLPQPSRAPSRPVAPKPPAAPTEKEVVVVRGTDKTRVTVPLR